MQFKPGMALITEGNKKSIISWIIRLGTGSWWTHANLIISDTELIESTYPRVRHYDLQKRIKELRNGGRDFVIMDLPGLTDEERKKIVEAAETFVGRKYAVENALWYGIFRVWKEGRRRMFCSRLVAKAVFKGIGKRIFGDFRVTLPEKLYYRIDNLEDGYCTPDELLLYSKYVPIHYELN